MVSPKSRGRLAGYSLLLPALLSVFFISIYPIIYAIEWSVYNTRYLQKLNYIGMSHYVSFFRTELHTVAITVYYCFGSLLLSVPLGVGVALLLNKPIRGRNAFRAIILLPWTMSQAVVGLLWKWLLDPSFGPVNAILRQLGAGPVMFFGSSRCALPTLIGVNVWMSYPLGVVLVLAALQTIPVELEEAARIDGAGGFKVFLYIKLHYIKHAILITIILQSLLYFNMVTLIYITTGGGPLRSTETMAVHLLKSAFERWRVGYASAVGTVMLVANVLLSLFYIKTLKAEK